MVLISQSDEQKSGTGKVGQQERSSSIGGQRWQKKQAVRVPHPHPDSRHEQKVRSKCFPSVSFGQSKAQPFHTHLGHSKLRRQREVSSESVNWAALASLRHPQVGRYLVPFRGPGAQKYGHVQLVLVLQREERPGAVSSAGTAGSGGCMYE